MEGDGTTSMTLPENLVEQILAMVPFPYIFKARALSKSWKSRFEPISSQDDVEKKLIAASFQKHVSQWSTNWKTFRPIFISKNDFVAYDRECQQWRKMPSLSFLPEQCFANSYWRMEGSLLLVVGKPSKNVRSRCEFFMANICTRSWRKLPPPPHHCDYSFHPFFVAKLIRTKSTYKVVVFRNDLLRFISLLKCTAQIYDPNLDAWSSMKQISIPHFDDFGLSDWVNQNEVFYRVVKLSSDIKTRSDVNWGLLAFNVNDGSFEILKMEQTVLPRPAEKGRVDLAVCNGSLLMLMYCCNHRNIAEGVIVLKIDLKCRRLMEMTRRAFSSGKSLQNPASDDNCIFFVGKGASGTTFLAYDIQEDEWSPFPCCPSEVKQWQVVERRSKTSQRFYYAQNWDRTGCCLDPFEAV